MDIKCKKCLCKNNVYQTCKARGILIDDKLFCKTFEKEEQNKKMQDVSRTMFQNSPKVVKYKHSKKLNIKCDMTKCIFNENGNCISNGITLIEGKKAGMCATEIKK